MKNLMYEIVCSDIRMTELKLNRIRISKEQLLKKKPYRLNKNKFDIWCSKLDKLNNEEEDTIKELQEALKDLENFL